MQIYNIGKVAGYYSSIRIGLHLTTIDSASTQVGLLSSNAISLVGLGKYKRTKFLINFSKVPLPLQQY